MFRIESDGTIKITRGDTARLTVNITNEQDGSDYSIESSDVITFTVKKYCSDKNLAFQKIVTGSGAIHIEPNDTAQMRFDTYKYDVQLTKANGDVYTVIGPATFEVLQEVTF